MGAYFGQLGLTILPYMALVIWRVLSLIITFRFPPSLFFLCHENASMPDFQAFSTIIDFFRKKLNSREGEKKKSK
jgi:hypothetical protein